MPPKSIFRQPGARHFQLVHRSQRDPLIHDPDASQHVLKEVVRENDKKGKTRAELESMIPRDVVAHDIDANVGEAALYGVYFDDTEYNYMQHLRPVGIQEDGVESVMIESQQPKEKSKNKNLSGITLKELPSDVLPSKYELPRTFDSQNAIPDTISGLQPDMDPHLRQVLEALEDDAFVDDGLDEDLFGELVLGGERDENERFDFEFHEDGSTVEGAIAVEDQGEEDSWERRFAKFKVDQRQNLKEAGDSNDGDDDSGTEGGDTISGLPTISVIGGKKRHKGTSDASGYSMSSSSMFRNDGLQLLDDRFDQVMLQQYNEDDDDELEMPDDDDEDAPQLITSREDFTSIMDKFLNDYEILGRKLKPKLKGETGAEKLDTLRRALGQDERVRGFEYDSDEDIISDEEENKKDRWDCETILTTYSNLENHPRLIRARDPLKTPKIVLNPKTGMPTVYEDDNKKPKSSRRMTNFKSDEETESEGDEPERVHREAVTVRPRDETAEEKKARKAAVKAEQAARRVEKKTTKEAFGNELKAQKKQRLGRDIDRGMKKM